MSSAASLRIVLIGALLGAATAAQSPAVGAKAPPIDTAEWLNWQGSPPTLESLSGRVVLLEFWGTWCAPCVRAMSGIQQLHDRYGSRGLTVLAISYESPDAMRPFLQKNAYTMPVGSDPAKKTITAYGVRRWPTTVVIDKEGKVIHVGSPYDAEAVVEKALGLEAGPGVLLTTYLDSLKSTSKPAQRAALERLVEKAPHEFDLEAWARGLLPPEAVNDGSPPPASPPPAATPVAPGGDPADVLRRCVQAWGSDPAQRVALLRQLGDSGSRSFDLAAFAKQAMGNAFPLEVGELKSLLKEKKYAAVIDAIAQRAPAPAVLATASKDSALATYCKSKVGEARLMAKKGIMAQVWLFPAALPRDEKVNEAFFDELSVSGMAMSPDRKSVTGVILGAEQVGRDAVAGYVQTRIEHALLMADLALGKAPRVRELQDLVAREREAIVEDLERRYGKAVPR